MAALTRVTVVTAGHLSTCPRMLKAADALDAAGYRVRVVSTRFVAWAASADEAVMSRRWWAWRVVDYDRASARTRQLLTGARMRGAAALARVSGGESASLAVAARAVGRVHDELVQAIIQEPADFIYGGTSGALAAVAEAARRLRVPFGLDLEDFHSAEQEGPDAEQAHRMIEHVERSVLPGAAMLTAGSPMIADAYASTYGVRPLPIHNTFSPQFGFGRKPADPFRMYWFSQTIGPGRGLEDVVRAAGRADLAAELHLRGLAIPTYIDRLRELQQHVAPRLAILVHAPAAPDEMVALARPYDLGLSLEEPRVRNRQMCLTNKIFTSLAAGVPVVLSATPAQSAIATDLGEAALVYEPGDVEALATKLRAFATDESAGHCARLAARAAAERRWHWEHPEDRGALIAAVASVVQ